MDLENLPSQITPCLASGHWALRPTASRFGALKRYAQGTAILSWRDVRRCRWYKIMQQTQFSSLAALRHTFPSADKVGEFVVFNIAGNKYRLIVSIHFNRGKVYIRHVLTHQAYDRGGWTT